jgi:hypothetical protein
MADIRRAYVEITGEQPNEERITKMQAVALALDIRLNDPIFPIIAMLEAYNGSMTSLPSLVADAVTRSATAAANSAANQASASVKTEVAGLVSGLTGRISGAVGDAVLVRQYGRSMITVALASIPVACVALVGWLAGLSQSYNLHGVGPGLLRAFAYAATWPILCAVGTWMIYTTSGSRYPYDDPSFFDKLATLVGGLMLIAGSAGAIVILFTSAQSFLYLA